MKPITCDVCGIIVPDPWTVFIDSVLRPSFQPDYKSKYPDWYSPTITLGENPPFEVGSACIAHYHQVKAKLEQQLKESESV